LIRLKAWRYAGRGYPRAGDALLAISMAARAREQRRLAHEEEAVHRAAAIPIRDQSSGDFDLAVVR
jgi:hypothetical protein